MISRLFSRPSITSQKYTASRWTAVALTLALGGWLALLPAQPAWALSTSPAAVCWPNAVSGNEAAALGTGCAGVDWIPITYNGDAVRDFEATNGTDPSANAGTGSNSPVDITSGENNDDSNMGLCNPQANPPLTNCGTEPSGYWACAQVTDDDGDGNPLTSGPPRIRMFRRMRLQAYPGGGSEGLVQFHWNYLTNIDLDVWKEFWFDAFGGWSGSGPDIMRIIYEDTNTNDVTNDNAADGVGGGTWINAFVACKQQGICLDGSNRELSHTRIVAVQNPAGGGVADTEYFLDTQVPLTEPGTGNPVLTDNLAPAEYQNPVAGDLTEVVIPGTQKVFGCNHIDGPQGEFGEPLRSNFLDSVGNSNTDPIQKDLSILTEEFSDLTFASIAYFRATRTGTGIRFEWQTSAELANAGFFIYEDTGRGWRQINESLIPGAIDSVLPQKYSYESNSVSGAQFMLSDFDLNNREHRHGPFQLDSTYGELVTTEPINWVAIQSEHDEKKKTRLSKRQDALRNRSQHAAGDNDQTQQATSGSSMLATAVAPAPAVASQPLMNIGVVKKGIQRVTYNDLLAAGLDLATVPAAEIALTYRDAPVPIRVETGGSALFGTGSYIEFIGEATDTFYTGTQVYRLHLDAALALRVSVDETPVAKKAKVVTEYVDTIAVNKNNTYFFTSPNPADAWAETTLFAPASQTFTIKIDNLVPRTRATLHLNVWGTGNLAVNPDHHMLVDLNGASVADELFDGNVDVSLDIPVSARLIQDGDNIVTLSLPFDLPGVSYDFVRVNSYALSYTRNLVARDAGLSFSGDGAAFRVDGFGSNDVVAYRVSGDTVTFLAGMNTQNGSATLPGSGGNSEYHVSAAANVQHPTIETAIEYENITVGDAEYLVIAHPDFVGSADLDNLVQSRLSDRFASAKVVNIEQIYAQFAGSNLDPNAIRQYIKYAVENLNTQVVLLVGGDTYDYRDYLGLGAVSFIPTLFTDVGDGFQHTPVDSLYADIDGDNIPDAGIGRLPARTSDQLTIMVTKTLGFSSAARKVVFAADDSDTQGNYASISDSIAANVPSGWNVQRIYLDNLGSATAHADLLDVFTQGDAAVVSYVGHSSPTVWTGTGNSPRLLNMSDAQSINSFGSASVVAQWGCWMDHLNPYYQTLTHRLLLNPNGGAVAAFGMAGSSSASADALLAPVAQKAMMQPRAMLGSALTDAKQQLAPQASDIMEVILGGTLLGDPALMVNP